MPLILVVEQEKRYVERIEQALGPHGLDVRGVAADAVQEHSPNGDVTLLVVNSEVPDASSLVSSFSRAGGGAGAVVLVPEDSAGGASDLGGDEVLHKPFTDQEISLAVKRCLSAVLSQGSGGQTAASESEASVSEPEFVAEDQLTSADIFGDVVLELESALSLATEAEDAPEAVEEPAEEPVEEVAEEASEEQPAVTDEAATAEVEANVASSVDAAFDALDVEESATGEDEVEDAAEAEEKVQEVDVELKTEEESVDEADGAGEDEDTEEPEEGALEGDEAEDGALEATEADEEAEAAPGEPEPAAPPKDEAADLIESALGALRRQPVRLDDEFAHPAEVSDAEIEEMVRSAIVGPQRPQSAVDGPVSQPTQQADQGGFEALESADPEDLESHQPDEAGWAKPGSRAKLVAGILIALAIIVILIFATRASGKAEDGGPSSASPVVGSPTREGRGPVDETAGESQDLASSGEEDDGE